MLSKKSVVEVSVSLILTLAPMTALLWLGPSRLANGETRHNVNILSSIHW